jgi:hypothetical protein
MVIAIRYMICRITRRLVTTTTRPRMNWGRGASRRT